LYILPPKAILLILFLISEGKRMMESFFKELYEELKLIQGLIVLIMDENVARFYGEVWSRFIEGSGLSITRMVLPAGERIKSRRAKEKVEDELLSRGVGRDGCLIAFGGGVITDLVGFVAATYKRGIDYISIPTTVMGMVDAAIGGKTGINTSFGKNTIGAFYLPRKIYLERVFLETLPQKEWKNGFAEVVKYGLIWDEEVFWNFQKSEMIIRSAKIKEEIVEKDFREEGLRRILNFGHTIAHAVELSSEYKVSHGSAVWFGLLVESTISNYLGYLKKENLREIFNLLQNSALSQKNPLNCKEKNLYEVMENDKKGKNSLPRFVLIDKIGRCASFDGEYCVNVKREIVEEAIQYVLREL
jgi:3-dehydroquinate synthase